MTTPTLVEMLKAGVHFGHKTSKWHPNMAPYIFTETNDVHIINLERTQEKLEAALKVVKDLAANGKTVLFVGTKKHAAPIVKKYAKDCGMPFVTHRWLGGTLTNFKTISSVAGKLTKYKKEQEAGELDKYTKKEQLGISKEIIRLESLVGGIEELRTVPDAVFIVDMKQDKTAVREAQQMGIPIVAMTDTNVDPLLAAYAIPANDDAVRSVDLIVKSISEAISEGAAKPAVQPSTSPVASKEAPQEASKEAPKAEKK